MFFQRLDELELRLREEDDPLRRLLDLPLDPPEERLRELRPLVPLRELRLELEREPLRLEPEDERELEDRDPPEDEPLEDPPERFEPDELRPDPLRLPPPSCLLTVAQARRSDSLVETPRDS